MSRAVDRALREALTLWPERPPPRPEHALGQFWDHAVQRGVAAVLAKTLQAPDAIRRATLAQAALGMRSKAILKQVLALCASEGIEALPLKGPLLGARLYPEGYLRPTSDVDLLVGSSERDHVLAVLQRAGGRLGTDAEVDYYGEHHHHVNVEFNGVLVEVHFRASTNFGVVLPSEPLLARSRPSTIEGVATRTLEPYDELVYLAVHAAAHNLGRDILLLDLRRLVERERIEPPELESRARSLGVERPVGIALAAAADRVGFPWQLVSKAGRRPIPRWLAFAASRIPQPEPTSISNRSLSLAVQAAFAPEPLTSVRLLAHHGSRVLKRRLHGRFPGLVPSAWEG